MSWSRSLVLFAAAAMLMGCGFRPLYGSGDAAETENELAAIQVRPIENRIGQILHNHLLDLLTPRGQPRQPKYELDVRLRESIARLGVEKSGLATRANLRITAKFSLLSPGGGLLFSGESVTISSFNILGSDVSGHPRRREGRPRPRRSPDRRRLAKTDGGIFPAAPTTQGVKK